MMYQKLVRDNIPAIIEKNGETCVTRKLTDKEYEQIRSTKTLWLKSCKKRSPNCWKPTQQRSGVFWTALRRWRM